MAAKSQRIDGAPTILWIAWRAGEVERQEPLCLAHRAHIFEHYPSAHGLKRRGERCAMCLAHPPQPAQLRNPRDSTTPPPGEAAEPLGRASRASGRRVSPTRHDPSSPPVRGGGRRGGAE
jgi:hypothetical protein